jgi:hypothetical protein
VRNAYGLQKSFEANGRKAVLRVIGNAGHEFPKEFSPAFEGLIEFLSN